MTGIELLKAPGTTAEQIVDIIAEQCPPIAIAKCDGLSCRKCWLAWLTMGEPSKETGPSDKQTAPDEEGLHPNLVEMYAKMYRRTRRTSEAMLRAYAACSLSSISAQTPAPGQRAQPQLPEP